MSYTLQNVSAPAITESNSLQISRIDKQGYQIFDALTPSELHLVQSIILSKINELGKSESINFSDWHSLLSSYTSNFSHLHSRLAPKPIRLFSGDDLDAVLKLSIFNRIRNDLGSFLISDEELYGFPEIYWRLVRPNTYSDVGPLHADGWFWDCNHWIMPHSTDKRVKIWVPIAAEPNLNGLLVVNESHNDSLMSYDVKVIDGKKKPVISSIIPDSLPVLLPLRPGQALAFNDSLLHGGAFNNAITPRISFEFTCCFNTKHA
ncbi:MAG: hypothetical protein CMM03_03560 [Rhodopirellula sp.]|nr:hypothetical protein [Rhodopirellula sp.]